MSYHRFVASLFIFSLLATGLCAQSTRPSELFAQAMRQMEDRVQLLETETQALRSRIEQVQAASAPAQAAQLAACSLSAPALCRPDVRKLGLDSDSRLSIDWGDGSPADITTGRVDPMHIYDQPGEYIVSISAGQTRWQATMKVAPAARRVIYVSNQGDDRADGSIAHPIASMDRVRAILDGAPDRIEILLARGGTYPIKQTQFLRGQDVRIGAWGQGERPHVLGQFAGTIFQGDVSPNPRCADVRLEDLWISGAPAVRANGVSCFGQRWIVRNCRFDNLYDGVGSDAQSVIVQGCQAPDKLAGYTLFVFRGPLAFIANECAGSTEQHVFRGYGSNIWVTRNHLSAPFLPDGTWKAALWLMNGEDSCITNNRFDGLVSFGPNDAEDAKDPAKFGRRLIGVRFFNNRINDFNVKIYSGCRDVLIADNTFRRDEFEAIHLDDGQAALPAERQATDIRIIGNTVTNRSEKGWFLRIQWRAKGIVVENNRYEAPNLKVPAQLLRLEPPATTQCLQSVQDNQGPSGAAWGNQP